MAKENPPFIDEFPIQNSIWKGFSLATCACQRLSWKNKPKIMHWPGSFNVQVSSTPKSFNTFELQAWDIFKSSGSLRRSHIPLFSDVNPTIPSDKRVHNVYQNLGFTSFFHRDINGFSMASLPSPEFRLLGFPTWESDSVYDDGTSLWRFVKLGGYMYTGEKKLQHIQPL